MGINLYTKSHGLVPHLNFKGYLQVHFQWNKRHEISFLINVSSKLIKLVQTCAKWQSVHRRNAHSLLSENNTPTVCLGARIVTALFVAHDAKHDSFLYSIKKKFF